MNRLHVLLCLGVAMPLAAKPRAASDQEAPDSSSPQARLLEES